MHAPAQWLPLAPLHTDDGPLTFAARSHLDNCTYFECELPCDTVDGCYEIETVDRLSPGDATLHAGRTFHFSHPNSGSRCGARTSCLPLHRCGRAPCWLRFYLCDARSYRAICDSVRPVLAIGYVRDGLRLRSKQALTKAMLQNDQQSWERWLDGSRDAKPGQRARTPFLPLVGQLLQQQGEGGAQPPPPPLAAAPATATAAGAGAGAEGAGTATAQSSEDL